MFGFMLLSVLAAATIRASSRPFGDAPLSSAQLAQLLPLLPLPGVLLHHGCSSTAAAACSAFAALSACVSCTLPRMMNTSDSLQQQQQQLAMSATPCIISQRTGSTFSATLPCAQLLSTGEMRLSGISGMQPAK
jgi:hypothetical protein